MLYYLEGNSLYLEAVIIMGWVILFRYLIMKSKVSIIILLSLALFFMFFLIKTLFFVNISSELLFSILFFIAHIGLAFYVIKGKYSEVILIVVFYIWAIFLFLQFINNVPPSNVIYVSENIVNFVSISFSVSVYLARYLKGKVIILNPAIITVIIAFWSSGRSGIIGALILLLVVLASKYNLKQKYLIALLVVSTLLLFTEGFINKTINITNNIITRGGTRDGIIGNVRFDIWKDYFSSLDFKTVMLGFNVNEVHKFFGFTDLHNSFLDGHYMFGIFMFFLILLIILAFLKLFIDKKFFPIILLIVFFTRGFTDTVIFVGRFDYLYIVILLCLLLSDSELHSIENHSKI